MQDEQSHAEFELMRSQQKVRPHRQESNYSLASLVKKKPSSNEVNESIEAPVLRQKALSKPTSPVAAARPVLRFGAAENKTSEYVPTIISQQKQDQVNIVKFRPETRESSEFQQH